jgi:hypothetical protein
MEHTDSTYFFVGQSDISNCLQKTEMLRKAKKNKILCQVFIMFVYGVRTRLVHSKFLTK